MVVEAAVGTNMTEPFNEKEARTELFWMLTSVPVLTFLAFILLLFAFKIASMALFFLMLTFSTSGLAMRANRYKNWTTVPSKDELWRVYLNECLLKIAVYSAISVAALYILPRFYQIYDLNFELLLALCAINLLGGFKGGASLLEILK